MEDFEPQARRALRAAKGYLDRCADGFTRSAREDLAQEALIEFWRSAAKLRDPSALEAFVRRITERRRYRALQVRESSVSLDWNRDLADEVLARSPAPPRSVRVADAVIEFDRLIERVDEAVDALDATNGEMLRGFYRGSSCDQLGRRHGLAPSAVKARLHRMRVRLRRDLEGCVQRARAGKCVGFGPLDHDSWREE